MAAPRVARRAPATTPARITRQEIEARVLVGLKERLLAPDLVAEFIAAVQDEVERSRTSRKAARSQHDKKLAAVEREIAGILTAIEDGMYDSGMKERLASLRAEKANLESNAAEPAEADLQVLLHPRLPDLYRRKVEALERVLDGPDRAEAMDLIRSMIDRVELRPRRDGYRGLDAMLFGDLAAILTASAGANKQKLPGAGGPPGSQLSVVAGTRNHLYRTVVEGDFRAKLSVIVGGFPGHVTNITCARSDWLHFRACGWQRNGSRTNFRSL